MLLGSSRTLFRVVRSVPSVSYFSSSSESVLKVDGRVADAGSKLKRGPDERDITVDRSARNGANFRSMDLIEERIRRRAAIRESSFGGQQQSWNYRSEIVGKLGLDNKHKNIWIAYAFIIIFGFGAFVYVKSNVVLSRKEEMEAREKLRRELKLQGADRKKLGVVDSY
ncbi:unnamed protein product [Nippostrongylus brasiliensis]|uniref:Cytochrome c oxidase assembly protein COX20, mitochondrial n=1 Tax=Nippostrongylus brasiliensis TaxID=27835 RepID=A0A0N4YAS3_NIPBR|nr:unnamed protein product [Nippostrongylus brasiliensis]